MLFLTCRKEAEAQPVNGTGKDKFVIGEQTCQDEEVGLALANPRFVAAMMKFYGTE